VIKWLPSLGGERLRSGEAGIETWRRQWPGWKRRLLALESRSLFDRKRLRDAMTSQ